MQTRTFQTAEGVEIFIALFGNPQNPALVLCHGLGADHRQWIADAEHFAQDRYVIVPDLRGHGQSTRPARATERDFSVAALSGDLASVLTQLGIRQCDFTGNSLGGLIGLELRMRDIGLIRHLITNGTAYELHFPKIAVTLKRLLTALLPPKTIGRLVAKSATPAARDLVAAMYSGVDKGVVHLIDLNIRDYSYLDAARNFDGPITLIKGARDSEINKYLLSTEALFATLPNARIVPLDGAGHFANLDQPQKYREIVREALSIPA